MVVRVRLVATHKLVEVEIAPGRWQPRMAISRKATPEYLKWADEYAAQLRRTNK
jgi:hypothetical protein